MEEIIEIRLKDAPPGKASRQNKPGSEASNKERELLARNIKEYRRICGFSQELLAEKAGTSTTHIGMIEIGKSFPSPQMLTRIAEALGIDTPELFKSIP